ncbi:MAG: hypothetical protein JWR80_3158 [Bradyrhizobium sp.]|nr:hypothetical protein [Bradyrhizobium sp.]
MKMQSSARFWLLAPLSFAVLPGVAHAQADVRVSADARADIGYSANPFSEPSGDTGSGYAEIQVSPQVKLVDEHSIFTLSGTAQYHRYFRRYGDSGDYGAGLDYSGTPGEHVKTHLNVKYDSSIIGRSDLISGVIDPALPDPPVTSGTDISLFGTRDRRQTLRGSGDMSIVLSARDSLAVSGYYIRSRYSQFGALGNNDAYGGSAGYSRQVTEHLQVGAQGSVARYNYTGLLGDSTVYSTQLVFSATLGPRWKADGAVGVSFVNMPTGGNSTSLSGNLRLCRLSTRSNFCLTARRAVLPTGITGTQNETSVGANYSYKVSERGTIFGAADYTKNGYSQLSAFGQNEYLRGSLGYEHVLRERVRIIMSGQYRQIFGGIVDRGTDYGGQFGIAVRLGDNR